MKPGTANKEEGGAQVKDRRAGVAEMDTNSHSGDGGVTVR